MLAQRTRLFGTSGTAAARAAAKAAEDAGMEIIDLSAGEIWADISPSIRDGALMAIGKGVNRYTDTIGMPELREAVAGEIFAETGLTWGPEQVALTTGAKQALYHAAMLLIDPGSEVIIPSPHWSTFPAQVQLAGGTPVFVDTRDNGYVPRIDDIAAAITDRTRAIIINTPNNPTGAVYPRVVLAGIAQLAIENDIWIIFDECYGSFPHLPAVHANIISLVPEVRDRTLLVNAFSKSLALTGWRLGYLAGPKGAIDAVKAFQSHTTSNPNVIAQHAVLAHLRARDWSYERGLYEILKRNRTTGLEILGRLSQVPLPVAEGGFYFYLDVSKLVEGRNETAADVAARLLSTAGVAAVSGTAFGDPTGLRLSYGIPHDLLKTGLLRLVDALETHPEPL